MRLTMNSITGLSLESAGLLALADLTTIAQRTALTGTSSYADTLVLAPGIHTQQYADNVNGGELPITGAMTSGYVFRIENQATVFFLQRIGQPGCLVNVSVERMPPSHARLPFHWPDSGSSLAAAFAYVTCISLSVVCFAVMGSIGDYWAVGVLGMLVVARAMNVVIMRRRAVAGWKGQSEPGVLGDLLILLSQDRWVRMQGSVDDIKLVTSGQWIRDMRAAESFAVGVSTVLVYAAAALAANVSTVGNLFIAVLLLSSVALLAGSNALTEELHMFNCKVFASSQPIPYKRRLDMAHDMILQHGGRRDFAIGMGLVLPEPAEAHV